MASFQMMLIFLNMLAALISMAFFTLIERKILAYLQIRKGPNKVSFKGLIQPISDALKLFMKPFVAPGSANKIVFMMAPSLYLMLNILLWSLYPYINSSYLYTYGLLMFLMISSLNVYTSFASGWSSNSKYALMGSIRNVAQLVSYEVSMIFLLLTPLIMLQTLDFNMFFTSHMLPLFMFMPSVMILWFITTLAETSRTPFDFTEGESELVSGYNVSYGGLGFTMLFMGEYMSIIFMSMLTTIIFLSSFKSQLLNMTILLLSTCLFSTLFVILRGALPRLRYDQLMNLTWKFILPYTLSMIIYMLFLYLNIFYL